MDERLREVVSEIANALQSAHSLVLRQRMLAEKSVETAKSLELIISRAFEAFHKMQKDQE